MGWRSVPPAYTPVPLGAVVAAGTASSRDVEALSEMLRARYDATGAILCDSGTSALRLAIEAATREGGAVALPAYACYDLVTAAVGARASVAFYDVDPKTLSADIPSLERALESADVSAIVVAHLYGVPVDLDAVGRIAEEHGTILIEDAAQGIGASWRGRPLGTVGDCAVLSFGRGKGWTGGGGGALLVRNGFPEISSTGAAAGGWPGAVAELLFQRAFSTPVMFRTTYLVPGLHVGETVYHTPWPSRSISPAAAAAVLASSDEAEAEAARRREIGEWWAAALDRAGHRRILPPERGISGWLRFPVRLPGGGSFRRNAVRHLGVGPAYPRILPGLEPIRERVVGRAARWPGARSLVSTLVTLPTHSFAREREREALLASLAKLHDDF